ncbi:type II toxin-antitoxin system VapC family toxin [Methylobrevis albus]|uniref:Ribonuclease VapC n=1 Tax=Methylobrevis albus TaxID=2793297 RepID=A0A931MZ70_9HYPH|nr:PIN domain-containing protein [Methylobrevis albus]MBH0238735.1 PIN domain-containing protein [Methylobrevis albus]
MAIYVDSNVVIAMFEDDGMVSRRLRTLAITQAPGLVTSELTLAEVLVGPLKATETDPEDARARGLVKLYETFLGATPGVEVRTVDRHVLMESALLRARFAALKLPDAVHLATALIAGAEVFLSADTRAATIAGKLGLSPLLPTIETVDQLLRDAG